MSTGLWIVVAGYTYAMLGVVAARLSYKWDTSDEDGPSLREESARKWAVAMFFVWPLGLATLALIGIAVGAFGIGGLFRPAARKATNWIVGVK